MRILAVFEPRSNTMKLALAKAQLPWALEKRRSGVLPYRRAGLGCQRAALAPLGTTTGRARTAATLDQLRSRSHRLRNPATTSSA